MKNTKSIKVYNNLRIINFLYSVYLTTFDDELQTSAGTKTDKERRSYGINLKNKIDMSNLEKVLTCSNIVHDVIWRRMNVDNMREHIEAIDSEFEFEKIICLSNYIDSLAYKMDKKLESACHEIITLCEKQWNE